MNQSDRVRVGRILGPWGVSGWVRVYSETDPPESLFEYQPWLAGPEGRPLHVAEWQRTGRRLVARLAEIADRTDAEALAAADLFIPRAQLPDTGPGQYYWHDLEGLEVVNTDGHRFGRVRSMLDAGAHDVLVIAPPDGGHDVLIPFVPERFVLAVDLAAGCIRVDWEADWVALTSPGKDDGHAS